MASIGASWERGLSHKVRNYLPRSPNESGMGISQSSAAAWATLIYAPMFPIRLLQAVLIAFESVQQQRRRAGGRGAEAPRAVEKAV